MAKHVYGVDFGTGNIKFYNGVTKKLLNEKNVIATKKGNVTYSFGDDAYEMYEKTPEQISVTFPIKFGVIADMERMTNLFEEFFHKVNLPKRKKSGDFCIAVPTDVSEVEKRAFYDLVADSKIKSRDIVVVEKPIADAVGIGIDVTQNGGNMIVDFGADTTEISVVASGGIVLSKILKIGGNQLDESIVGMIKKKYNILVGNKTAEIVKIALANPIASEEEKMASLKVFGRNIISGLPASKIVTSDLVNDAINPALNMLVDTVQSLIERTPPDLAADITEKGIYLTGGSSNIPNINQMISQKTNLKVNIVKNPSLSVINGIAIILANPQLKELLYTPCENDY